MGVKFKTPFVSEIINNLMYFVSPIFRYRGSGQIVGISCWQTGDTIYRAAEFGVLQLAQQMIYK